VSQRVGRPGARRGVELGLVRASAVPLDTFSR
jgi:hypothetical protein